MFREVFPENFKASEAACKRGDVRVGHMFITKPSTFDALSRSTLRMIINFPTKKHWRNPSELKWIQSGLQDLIRVVRETSIKSVALPALGCGLGGLEWPLVRREIESALAALPDVEFLVFEPQH